MAIKTVGSINTIETEKNGKKIKFSKLSLNQNIDLMVDGEVVNFPSYTAKNGKTYLNKDVFLQSVDDKLKSAEQAVQDGKLGEDVLEEMKARYKKSGTKYILSVKLPS